MSHPQKHIEALEKSVAECELISQLTPNKSTKRARLADSSLSPKPEARLLAGLLLVQWP